jgi:hypothetical protein
VTLFYLWVVCDFLYFLEIASAGKGFIGYQAPHLLGDGYTSAS